MGIKALLKKGLIALVMGSTAFSPAYSFAGAKPKQEISVSESKANENASVLIDNSRYVLDPGLVISDSISFEFDNLKEGSVGVGGINQVMNYIFATPGKFRRPAFMAWSYFGKRRPNYVELNWHKLLTQHMVIGAYDGELHLVPDFVNFNEWAFDDLRGRFGFDEFEQKPIMLLYKNGNEFLQDKIFYPGRGTAGVTKVLGKNEMATYFNGHREDFAHTNKHEFVHWFDLQRIAHLGKVPGMGANHGSKVTRLSFMKLWMIEGLAEYYSIGWSNTHEQIMRDLWNNNIFIPMEDLDMYRGSFLTYTMGNFYTKFLEETFGPGTALKLRDNAVTYHIEEILKDTTNYDLADLNRMAAEYAQKMFSDMEGKKDDRKVLTDGFLLASDSDRFLTWGFDDGHIKMYLNKFKDKGLVKKKVVQDVEYGFESLMSLYFGAGIDISGNRIAFSANDGGRDKLVVQKFLENEDSFSLEDRVEKAFGSIDEIYSPRFVNDSLVVFAGSAGGYQDLFSYDFSTDELSQLTDDKRGIDGLDVSGDLVVFSREDELTSNPNGIDYNFNLHLFNLKTKESSILTSEDSDETRPRFSPDGRYVVFQKDVNFVNNLFIHDFKTGVTVRLDREIVGAENPQFLDNSRVLLNTRNLLRPYVRVRELGSLESLVRGAIEDSTADDIGTYRIRKNELLLKDVLSGPDNELKVNGDVVKEIISHNGSSYLITDENIYKASGPIITRENPVPRKKRIEEFLKTIPEDVAFLEKKSMIYDIDVSEDGSRAVIFLNNTFFDDEAFTKLGFNVTNDATPILVYSGGQSLFKEGNQPQMLFDTKDLTAHKENVNAEFLANGETLLWTSNATNALSPMGGKGILDMVNELRRKEEIDGYIEKIVVAKDKKAVAFKFYDDDHFTSDDHAIVVYDGRNLGTVDVVVNTESYVVDNMMFLDDGRLFFTTEDKKSVGFYSYDPATRDLAEKVYNKTDGDKLSGVISAAGNILFSTANKKVSELHLATFGKEDVKKLSERKMYSGFRSIDDLILYEENDVYGSKDLKTSDLESVVIHPGKLRNTANSHAIINDGGALYDIELGKANPKKLAEDSFGFDVKGNTVVFSKADKGVFNISTYDSGSGEMKVLTSNKFNSFRPVFADDAIYYEAEENGKVYIRKIKDGVDEKLPLSAPTARLEVINSELQGKVLPKDEPTAPAKPKDYSYTEGVLDKSKFSPWPIHNGYGSALMAFDGHNFIGVLGFVGFNELNTNLAFIDLYLAPDFKMGSAGFVDLARDYAIKSSLVEFSKNIDSNLELVKSVPFNAHLGMEGSFGMNYQDYPGYQYLGHTTRRNFYPSVSASVSYDDTTFDYLRGPNEGTRGFLRLETGYSLTDNIMNHYDVNFDVRNYIPFIGRFGSSQRLMAGTSQGPNNHFYYLGGNISMRGIPFDGLLGQNYAVANLDVRIPIFEAVGVAFAGTNYLFPIFSAFDVRAGPYLDGGVVWDNRDKPSFLYSGGIDVNGIFFGSIILRYNKGMWGEKDWNFWLGYSP